MKLTWKPWYTFYISTENTPRKKSRRIPWGWAVHNFQCRAWDWWVCLILANWDPSQSLDLIWVQQSVFHSSLMSFPILNHQSWPQLHILGTSPPWKLCLMLTCPYHIQPPGLAWVTRPVLQLRRVSPTEPSLPVLFPTSRLGPSCTSVHHPSLLSLPENSPSAPYPSSGAHILYTGPVLWSKIWDHV